MLFNYDNCHCSKNRVDDIKIAMSNILPSNVCNTIGEYKNMYCNKCCKLKDGEERFMKDPQNCHSKFSKFQLQLKYFMETDWKRPISFYFRIRREPYEKDIDEFFSNQGLIERLGVKKINPYKAYLKRHRELFDLITDDLYCPHHLRQTIDDIGIDETDCFKYNNKNYNVIVLISDFMCEYTRALIGEDNLHYLNDENDIVEYVDNVLEVFYV